MLMEFTTVEALTAFGIGCTAGYGFALRALMPSMIASRVKPLEVQLKTLQDQVKDLTKRLDIEEAFNRALQEKIFGLDIADDDFEGLDTRISTS